MKVRRTVSRLTTAALAIATAAHAVPALAAEKLIYATYITDVYSASKSDIWLMNEIEKRSGGEIKFEKYWASSLLKAADLFPGLASGAADVVLGAPHGYNVKEYPLANIVMPFTTTKGDAITRAWRDLYKNNIAKLSDLKGLKIRAVPTISDAVGKLGATPVALAWPDGLEGLQRGLVEAMASAPFDSAVHGNVQDVAKYGTDLGGTGIFAMATIAISKARYEKLSEKHRKIIDEVAAEAPEQGIRLLNESLDAAVDKLCGMKEKLTISDFSDADKAEVKKLAGTGLQEDWLKRVKTETKADGPALLNEFLGYVRNYEKTSTYTPGFERYKKKCG